MFFLFCLFLFMNIETEVLNVNLILIQWYYFVRKITNVLLLFRL